MAEAFPGFEYLKTVISIGYKKEKQVSTGGMKVEKTKGSCFSATEMNDGYFWFLVVVKWRLCHESEKNVFYRRPPWIDHVHVYRWFSDGGW